MHKTMLIILSIFLNANSFALDLNRTSCSLGQDLKVKFIVPVESEEDFGRTRTIGSGPNMQVVINNQTISAHQESLSIGYPPAVEFRIALSKPNLGFVALRIEEYDSKIKGEVMNAQGAKSILTCVQK
jgi:hypothetical protein